MTKGLFRCPLDSCVTVVLSLLDLHYGEKALGIVEAESPNLIFMDIQLPRENGLDLTKKIKERYPRVIVVVVTTYDIPEYREAAFRYGANRFMPKDSLDWKEIEDVVESLI